MPSITAKKSCFRRLNSRLGPTSAWATGLVGSPAKTRSISRAPLLETGALLLERAAFVGDVVHLAAEGVDRVHGVAPLGRQQAHRRIERRAAGLDLGGDVGLQAGLKPLIGVDDRASCGRPLRLAAAHRSPSRCPRSPENRKSRLVGFTRSASGSRRRSSPIMRSARRTMVALSARRRKSFRTPGSCRASVISASVSSRHWRMRLRQSGARELAGAADRPPSHGPTDGPAGT